MATTAEIGEAKQWASKHARLEREPWAEGQVVLRLHALQHPGISRETAPIPSEDQKPGWEDEVVVELVQELRGYLGGVA